MHLSLLPLRSQNPSRNTCDNTAEHSSETLLEIQGVRDHLLLLSWGAPGWGQDKHIPPWSVILWRRKGFLLEEHPTYFWWEHVNVHAFVGGVTAWSVSFWGMSLHELSLPSPVAHAVGCKGKVMALGPHRRKELRVSANSPALCPSFSLFLSIQARLAASLALGRVRAEWLGFWSSLGNRAPHPVPIPHCS